jgi:uncharacterized membrane protein YhfC
MPAAPDTWLVPCYVVSIAIQLLFPLALAIWVRRRHPHGRWRFFGLGAAVFFVSQILTRIPLMQLAQYFLRHALKRSKGLLVGWIAFGAVTAGLFEEVGRYLGFRWLWGSHARDWESALMYGVGHGGLESMLLTGGLSILGLVNVLLLSRMDLTKLPLNATQLEQARAQQAIIFRTPGWTPLMSAVERVFAIAVQVSMSVLVLQCFVRESLRWLWVAVGYHAMVDFVPVVLAQLLRIQQDPGWKTLLVEGVVALFAIASLVIIRRLRASSNSAT